MASSFRISGVPLDGPDGIRNNMDLLFEAIAEASGPGRVVGATIQHDEGCPCILKRESLADCTCTEVDVVVIDLMAPDGEYDEGHDPLMN